MTVMTLFQVPILNSILNIYIPIQWVNFFFVNLEEIYNLVNECQQTNHQESQLSENLMFLVLTIILQ